VVFTNGTLDDAGIENNFFPASLLALNAGPGASKPGSPEYLLIKAVAAATPALSAEDVVGLDELVELLVLDVLPQAAATKPRLATTNPIRTTGCFNVPPLSLPMGPGNDLSPGLWYPSPDF
jgi:hypothetical protein